MAQQRTLVLIKPDAFERRLVGSIISRIEHAGYSLVDSHILQVTREFAEVHYAEHRGKVFFDELCGFLSSGSVMAMVVEGEDVIQGVRTLVACIRKELASSVMHNLIHASDKKVSAEMEIGLWFNNEDWTVGV